MRNTLSFIQKWRTMLRYERKELLTYLLRVKRRINAWNFFWADAALYTGSAPGTISSEILLPMLYDKTSQTQIEPIYFYQDTWAFEKIVQAVPTLHVDIGSHHKTVALLSKVVPVTMIDIRPLSLSIASLTFKQGSILEIPFPDNSLSSISSLCVIEHIGLGRYGDEIDPSGTEKALAELKRVVHPGGNLYISLPIDDVNRVYFNAHRAFSEDYLFKLFDPFTIVEKRYIFGTSFSDQKQAGFGVGCYHLRK